MSSAPAIDRLRIVSYNIAHGRGLAASNWRGGSAEERLQRLHAIAGLLRELDADIVVLNEVDVDASWSHGVNQVTYLAEQAGYPWRIEQRNLDLRVAWRTWRFGNAVLSRHPLTEASVIDLPGYAWWETVLAGKKRGIACRVETPAVVFDLRAVHLSHRSEDLRVASMRQLLRDAGSASDVVIAGDLNSTPSGWPLSQQGDQGSNAMDMLLDDTRFRCPPAAWSGADKATYRADEPDRVIDWIAIPRTWRLMDHRVILSTLSDHRPVVVEVEAVVSSGEP